MDLYSGTGETEAQLDQVDETPTGAVEETTSTPAPSAPSLSPTEVKSMIAEALAQTDQVWNKRLQSQLDKRDSGLIKRIEASQQVATRMAKTAQAGGMDEAQAKALGQQYVIDEISTMLEESNQPPAKNGKPQPQADDTTEIDMVAYQQWITRQADEIRADFDMPYDADEMKTIVTDQSPDEYIASVRRAGRAYRERMSKQQRPARPARAPGLGPDGGNAPRNPIATIENTGELYKMAAKE